MLMKRLKQLNVLVLIALLTLFSITFQSAKAEIKNGYENEYSSTIEALNALYGYLLLEDLSSSQRNAVKASIKSIESTIIYYRVTEQLLIQFRKIAPDIYKEIDTIVDKKGRSVDVYVRFVPRYGTKTSAWGITFINQSNVDNDTYISEFGEHTVSVKIWTVNKALLVLAHELGHVNYQVANLDSYMDYYMRNYSQQRIEESDCLGHDPKDPSGNSAVKYEKRFRRQYSTYCRLTKQKVVHPALILSTVRNQLRAEVSPW